MIQFPQHKWILVILPVATICAYLWMDLSLLVALLPLSSHSLYEGLFSFLSFLVLPSLHLLLWIVLYLLFRFCSSSRRSLSPIFFQLALVQCVTILLSKILKVILGRARPIEYIKEGVFGFHFLSFTDSFHSFPSGHTMTSFGLLFSISLLYPRYRIPLFCTGCFLSSSRVFLLDHYVSDLLGSLFLSSILANIAHSVVQGTLNQEIS